MMDLSTIVLKGETIKLEIKAAMTYLYKGTPANFDFSFVWLDTAGFNELVLLISNK